MAADYRTRILVVDDSAVTRSLLRSVVSQDASLEVAGTAADGASALDLLATVLPDLILLDVDMPVMDGLATLRQLRARGYRMPVIMCSSLTRRGAEVTIEALATGASDYVEKPSGQLNGAEAMRALAEDLIPKIRALAAHARAQGQPHSAPRFRNGAPAALPLALSNARDFACTASILAIGASTGGPAALDFLLPMLPADFALPVLIVQHMPELFTRLLAERLNSLCQLPVREAAEGIPVSAGTIYIARGNRHLEVLPPLASGLRPTLHLSQGPLENHCRPAVDVLFRSATKTYGSGVLALVLTGMGSDGLNGCRIVRERGGGVLVQDQASSTVWGMPGAVADAGLAHRILALDAIAPEVLRFASRTPVTGKSCEAPSVVV
jgi:two-component system chemotaxis response regulator CheB